jgi:DNA polymerase
MSAQIPPDWTRRILLVGEAPGAHEDQTSQHPFSGKSGTLLRQTLADAGFGEGDVAFTNSVRCRPPGNGTPTMTQIRCCRPFLLTELDDLAPQAVLGVGTTAARALTNNGAATVQALRGRWLRDIAGLARPAVLIGREEEPYADPTREDRAHTVSEV